MTDEPVEAVVDKPDEWWTALEAVREDTTTLAQRLAETRAEIASIKLPPAQITKVTDRSARPWWAPDAQGMLAGSIVAVTATALFVRMFHTSVVEDKMLDTMITILFSTCLVTVYQYTFGSSRGSSIKDDSQTKLVEKLVPTVEPKS